MVVTRNSRSRERRGKKTNENVVETAEVMETAEEVKKDNDEPMEAEDEKAGMGKDVASEGENENNNLKRNTDSNGTATDAKKFRGRDGEQIVEVSEDKVEVAGNVDEADQKEVQKFNGEGEQVAEDEGEVSEDEDELEQNEDEFNIFMTRYAGKWVKLDSVPLLEKFKADAERETDKKKKWKLQKIYKNALKNAEKKLAWEQKMRRKYFPHQDKNERVPTEIAPVDLSKFKISQKTRNKLQRMRVKLRRQRKNLHERNRILGRMARKAEKSQARFKVVLEKKKKGKNSKSEEITADDITMDVIEDCI